MPLATGEVFAGYTILRLLGSGGMGEVYLFRTNTRQLPGCFVFRDSGVTRSSLVPA
jgi:hypothetical protein